MKIFIDSADPQKIGRLAASGLVDGVTTNPTLMLKAGLRQKDAITRICRMIRGPVSVEGVGETAEQMVKDGQEFASWAKNVVVKIPMGQEGLKAVRALNRKGIKTNVTLVFSVNQALLAAKAGATFVSPFVGRLDDIGENGMKLVEEIMQVYRNYGFRTQVIVASVRSEAHVAQAAKAGAHIATVPPEILEKMFLHPLTEKGIAKFKEDWDAAKKGQK
ncbi:MAG: fructose-6-phosphate aldolase [Candidatus Micrarchaeota archaeon]|nr:fructose-6-phosphate aldolase [Candidatus Micrarchaeota archaeon]